MADVRLPSGKIISNVPDGVSQAQLKELAISSGQFTEDDFKIAQPTTQPPYSEEELAEARALLAQSDPGFLDTLQEIPKGIASGAVGMTESAVLGAATLLDEEAETGFREDVKEFTDPIQQYLQADAGLEDSVTRKFSEALGSFVPLAATGFIPGVGLPLAAGMGVGAGAGEASERAREAGATEEERSLASGFGALVGATEVLPVGALVGRFRKGAGDDIAAEAEGYIMRAFKAAGQEGAQEAAATVAQNLIAKNIYDPTTGTFTGSGEAFGYGAGVGGFVQGLLDLVVGRRGGAGGPTDTGADGEGVSAPDGGAGAGPTAVSPTDDVPGGVDVPAGTTADAGAGEGVSGSPLVQQAKDELDRAETLYTATQAEFDRKVGELEADETLGVTVEQATQTVREREPDLVNKLELATADRDAKQQLFTQAQETAQLEADAQAQREQPKTTETTVEKTTPEGETTVETTRTEEVKQVETGLDSKLATVVEGKVVTKTARELLAEQQRVKQEQDKRRELLENTEVATATAEERGETVEETQQRALDNLLANADRETELDELVADPNFKDLQAEESAKASKIGFKDTTDPNAERVALGLAPEPETPTLATMAEQHRKDMEANQKGRRRKALKKVAALKKDAGLAYQQAQAKARATVVGRARKQLTDEEIQTRTQAILDASPELAFLRKAVALEQELGADIAAIDKLPTPTDIAEQDAAGLERTRVASKLNQTLRAVEDMTKEGTAEGAPAADAGPGRYEERDISMLEGTRSLEVTKAPQFKEFGQTNGFPTEPASTWFRPVNAYRIYASKTGNLDEVIDMIAFDMVSGTSAVAVDKETTVPKFRRTVDNITENEKRLYLNLTKEDYKNASKEEKDRAATELKNDETRQFNRSFDYGMGNKIVAEKAAEWVMNNMSPKAKQRMQARIEHFRNKEAGVKRTLNALNITYDEDIAAIEERETALQEQNEAARDEAEKPIIAELKKETEAMRKDFRASRPIPTLLKGQTENGGVLQDLDDYALANIYNKVAEVAANSMDVGVFPDAAVANALETEVIQDLIQDMRIAGRFKQRKKITPKSNQEAVTNLSAAILEQQQDDAVATVMGMPEAKAMERDYIEEYLEPEAASLGEVSDVIGLGTDSYMELPANAVLATEADVHPAVTMALKEGSLFQALRRLSNLSANPRVAKVARIFSENLGDTRIVMEPGLVNDRGEESAGFFNPQTNTITLNADMPVKAHTILHEVSHALTADTLGNSKAAITKQLTKVFNDVKGRLGTAYGTTNLDEFVAEFKSNDQFRAMMHGVTANGDTISALERVTQIIRNFFRRMFGLQPKGRIDLTMDQIDNLIDSILDPAPPTSSRTAMHLLSGRKGATTLFDRLRRDMRREGGPLSKKKAQEVADKVDTVLQVNMGRAAKNLAMGGADLLVVNELAESYGLGDIGFQTQRVIETQRDRIRRREESIKQELDSLAEFFDKEGPLAEETFDELIYNEDFGATLYQVDPARGRSNYLNKDGTSKIDDNGNDLAAVWDAQHKYLERLPADQRKRVLRRFKKHRLFYAKQRRDLIRIIKGTLEDIAPGEQQSAFRKSLLDKLTAEQNTLEIYFPLERKGDFMMVYNIKKEFIKEGSPAYEVRMFPTLAARQRAEAVIRERNDVDLDSIAFNDTGSVQQIVERAPPNSFVTQLLQALEANSELQGNTEFREQVLRTFVQALPQTALARSLQKRKGVLGFEKSSIFALKERAFDFGRQIERLRTVKGLNAQESRLDRILTNLPSLPTVLQTVANNPNMTASQLARLMGTTPTYVRRMLELSNTRNPARAAEKLKANAELIGAELKQRIKFAREGADNKSREKIVKNINQFAFLYTIGLNVSSSLVNLSQVPLFVFPYLSGEYGIAKTYKAIRRAQNQVGFLSNNIEQHYDINVKGVFSLKPDIDPNSEKGKLLLDLMPMVQESSVRGLLNQTNIADVLGLGESRSLLDTITTGSAFMFNHAERYNRQVTLMTTYQLELDRQRELNAKRPENKKLPESVVRQKSIDHAIKETQRTNGGTVLETGMRYAQQDVGRVALMYKGYGVRMYTTMFQAARDFVKGMYPGADAESKRKRNVAMRQLAGLHGTSLIFAGVYGMPIYGMVQMMYDLFAEDDEDDFDTAVRKFIGEGYFKGPINELTGVDVASRVRLNNLVLQENRYNLNASPEENILFYLGGPALSTGKRFARGVSDIATGEVQRGIENILPAAVTNAYKASPLGRYQADGGIYTRRGDPIYTDMTAGDLTAQFFGFPPAEYIARQERNLRDKRVEKAVTTERTKLLKQYYVGMRHADTDVVIDTMDKIIEFNLEHPYAVIDPKSIERSMKQHVKSSQEMFDGVSISPLMREAIRMSRMEYDFY